MAEQKFENLNTYCQKNNLDLNSLVRIIKSSNQNVYRVGTEYLVESERVIERALQDSFTKKALLTEKKRKVMKDRADYNKQLNNLVKELESNGLDASNFEEKFIEIKKLSKGGEDVENPKISNIGGGRDV